jgi:decaprenylphosphoryl-5-phosphoribose phosphatase
VGIGLLAGRPIRTAATVWGTLGMNYAVKLAVRRERPAAGDAGIPLPSSPSFPSSHAAMSAAAAVELSDAHPRLAPLWIGMAAAMALTRITLRAHHTSDVVAGVVLGTATGLVATRIGAG